MDKRQNNKKHNKNKQNNNKNKNTTAQQSKVEQSNGQPTSPGSTSKKPALSRKEKETLMQLKALLRQHSAKCQNPKEEWQQYEKIQEILHNIRQVEQPLPRKRNGPGSNEERLANIDKFYQWAKDNGLHSNGVDIQKFPEYDLGLMATKDIKKNDLLFSIPRKLILSEENLQCEKVRTIFPLSNVRLALALMIEFLKPDSFWKPYIDLLPDSYNTVLYYTAEEMAELKGSNALSSALHQCQVVARYYLIISSMDFPLKEFNENFNYELFR
ncbi:hypothetical protein DOY81_013297 [Sarcophaga bullata]|nr:hypothetical protein DOY81_013297 [Sarcophaga bullata]